MKLQELVNAYETLNKMEVCDVKYSSFSHVYNNTELKKKHIETMGLLLDKIQELAKCKDNLTKAFSPHNIPFSKELHDGITIVEFK